MNIKTNETIYNEAHLAGIGAVSQLTIEPMVVVDSRTKQQWVIEDGLCGFAWVIIKPAHCSFAKYLKENHGAHKHNEPGLMLWISGFNQSLAKKSAYAQAFAKSLNANGIDARYGERVD